MTRIYLAGPMFSESELTYNRLLRDRLAPLGVEAVLPQDEAFDVDGERLGDRAYRDRLTAEIFEADLRLLESCDALVIVLDGRVPDEGACVELGYAYAKGIPCFGYKTDTRVSELGGDNAMICGAVKNKIAESAEELARMLLG